MTLDYRASINHRVSKSGFLVKSMKHFLFLNLKILHIQRIELYSSTYHTINMCNYFKYTSMCLWVYYTQGGVDDIEDESLMNIFYIHNISPEAPPCDLS